MDKKAFDPKVEVSKMAVHIVDEATTQFIDYVDGMPGKQPSRQEKWELMEIFWDAIVKEIGSRRTDR